MEIFRQDLDDQCPLNRWVVFHTLRKGVSRCRTRYSSQKLTIGHPQSGFPLLAKSPIVHLCTPSHSSQPRGSRRSRMYAMQCRGFCVQASSDLSKRATGKFRWTLTFVGKAVFSVVLPSLSSNRSPSAQRALKPLAQRVDQRHPVVD